MKKLLLYSVFILITFGIVAQKKAVGTDKRLQGLDTELEKLLIDWHAAGFAVAIVEKDKIVYARGFGLSDIDKKTPVNARTIFAIGSCTKAFTTSLLGILESEGKLKFSDRPAKYVNELKFYNDDLNKNISIEDLMVHRTGIPRHDYAWYFFPSPSKDSLVQRIEFHKPFAGLREKWYYNNFMYLTQGIIAERISGKTWEQNIQERFFEPLGMAKSSLTIDGLQNNQSAATGYGLKDNKIIEKHDYFDIAGMSPAGSINSNVEEMGNWLITWINGGKFKGKEIIPPTFVSNAMGSQMVVRNSLPDKELPDVYFANYGYGWFVSSYKGHYRVEHGGNIDGFSANVSFFPSDSIGVVVLANQNGSVIPSIARNIIADRMLKLKPTDWNKRMKDQFEKGLKAEIDARANSAKNQKTGTKASHAKIEYTGTYSHPGYGSFEILFKDDSLFVKSTRKLMWLKHYHYDVFVPYEVIKGKIDTSQMPSVFVNFRTDDLGEISGFTTTIEPAIEAQEFKRKPLLVEMDKSVLENFVGEYEIGGMIAKVYLKGDKDLYLYVPGQPEYELLAVSQILFMIKILDGYKVEFLKNEEGKVDALLFIQPNGTFKAIKAK